MDLTQREEQVVTADDTVSSLGLVFVNLPPLPPPPMIVKHVHSGTWAETAGIGPGCEVLELGGLKVGNMTREEFQKVIKSRPLRIRVQPPNCTAWKQVAHFQREVVRLQLKKVLLQKSLRDEHDKVKAELGLDVQAEEERRTKNKESKAEIARERQRAEDQKQQLLNQEAEIQKQKQQCEAFDRETQNRRRKLETEKVQLEKQQAELEKARSDFQELRKSSREAFEKEKQELVAERRLLEAQKDQASLAAEDNEAFAAAQEGLQRQRQELADQRADFEMAIEQMRLKMEREQETIFRERAEMEEDAELIATQRAELQAQKSKVAALEAEIDKQRAEVQVNQDQSQHQLESQRLEMSQLRAEIDKERADFSEKCKKVQQQLATQKRQLAQVKNKLVAEKNALEAEKAKFNVKTCEEATQTEASQTSAETQTDAVVVAPASALEEAEEGNQESSENTDPSPAEGGNAKFTAQHLVATELMELTAKIQALLQDPKFDSKPSELRVLSDTLQRMVETLPPAARLPGAAPNAVPSSARRLQKSRERMTQTHRAASAFATARSGCSREDLDASFSARAVTPETTQSENLAKKALAQTVVVRKLLASELNKQEPLKSPSARSLSRTEPFPKNRTRGPAWGLRSRAT